MNTPPPDERGGRARAKSISVTPVSQHTRVHVPQPTVNPLTSPNFHSQDPKVNGSPLQIHGIPCDPAPAASPNFKDPSDNGASTTGATTTTTMIPPKKEHNIEEVIATIFSYNKRSGQIFYNIQVCTRTTQGELEIRILSYQIKSFVTLYKQLKQIRADISVDSVQKKLIDDEDALTLGKKKFLLQRFIDAISLDKKLFNFQPVAEFFGLNRDPDKVIPPLKVNDWKVAAESDKAEVEKAVKDIVLEHKLAMEVNSSLTSTILILNNTIQESSARIKKLELDERAHVMEEKLWSVKTESIKEWALSSIDQLNEEIKIKQEQITVLVKTCNGLSIENEKLREELRKTNAKFTAYEKSAREEIARNEYLRARVFELETENASLATRLTRLRERNTGSTTETATDGSETKESEQQQQQQQQGDLVRRIKELEEANKELTIAKFESDKACHEAAALRLEVIKLNRVIESIKAENEAHARETTDMLSSLIKKEKDSKIFADKCTTENKQLKEEIEHKITELEATKKEMATLEGMLKANQTKIEQLSIELKVSETGKFGSDAHASLLKFQTRQLLHEIAVMTVEREEQRAAQSTQHAEGRRAHLIHSEQHEDLGTWEELERQNAGYKEQIVQLGTQITILKAQKEELEKEKAAQQIAQVRERAQSTIVPPKKRAPDPAQEENVVLIQSIMMDLQKKLSALNEELSEVKEKYFYDLAERIKKKLRSKVQLPRLYSEFLSHGPQRVDMWADWITAMIKAEM